MEIYNELNEFAEACREAKVERIFIDVRPNDEKAQSYIISCTTKGKDTMVFQDVMKATSVDAKHTEIATMLSKIAPLKSGMIVK